VHTEHIGKLGWYEWIFFTPSNHRVHHAQNDRYLDRNYGGLFILWDRLFGTFQEELESDPPIYGIRGPLRSFNPLWALTHIYVGMFRDSWNAAHWSDKVRVWVSRTGWRPADLVSGDPQIKPELADFVRFDPPVSKAVRAYAFFQLLAVVALLGYLQAGAFDGYGLTVAVVLSMLLTTMTTAFWMEGRALALSGTLDLLRLSGFAVGLIAFGEALGAASFLSAVTIYLVVNFIAILALLGVSGSTRIDESTAAV
ncbi:MAG: sterol desaturase family protein, partial [Congregibacter sp.]|nr:sterol desaturase family protein [Congregibacter sp.]